MNELHAREDRPLEELALGNTAVGCIMVPTVEVGEKVGGWERRGLLEL
jgi:hypothetical protein